MENEINRLTKYISDKIPGLIDFAIGVVLALLVFWIGAKLIKWIRKLIRISMEKASVDKGVRQFVDSLVKFILYAILIFSIGSKFGLDTTSVAAALASCGVAIGLALQGSLSNFAGGVIILVFRPYKVGDYIEASTGASGTVTDIQIFHTVLTTPDNKVIFAPNGAMSGAVVTNYSRKDTRRVDFSFGVEYGTDFNQAKSIIMEVINKDSRILKDPAPFVELGALADSSVNITVRVWVNAADYWAVNFDMNKNVYATFNEKGISFPFPQLTVHQA